MRRGVYLPSYLVSGDNETSLSSEEFKHCVVDTDCSGSLICYSFDKLKWLNGSSYDTLDFYQHDNIDGSMNFIKFTNKPKYNFCGCSIIAGWTGLVAFVFINNSLRQQKV